MIRPWTAFAASSTPDGQSSAVHGAGWSGSSVARRSSRADPGLTRRFDLAQAPDCEPDRCPSGRGGRRRPAHGAVRWTLERTVQEPAWPDAWVGEANQSARGYPRTGMGGLHAEQPARDFSACDLKDVVRPEVGMRMKGPSAPRVQLRPRLSSCHAREADCPPG